MDYNPSGIREQRRFEEKRFALQEKRLACRQRRLAALAKIDEGHEELAQADREDEELQQAERELEALGLDEKASSEQAAEADRVMEAPGPDERTLSEQSAEVASDEEPKAIGEKSKRILKEQAGVKHSPRDIAVKLYENGWVDAAIDMDVILQRLRHSLRRIAERDPSIHRDASGTTFYYWYAAPRDDTTPVP